MSKADRAAALFEKYNCAQAVLAACCGGEELSEHMCLKLAGSFGGGMGRMGETCGALTGAFLVLGVRDGEAMATDPERARGPYYEKVRSLAAAFRARTGGLSCRELTGCDLRTPEGQQEFKTRELHQALCRKLVVTAVELVTAGAEPLP